MLKFDTMTNLPELGPLEISFIFLFGMHCSSWLYIQGII